MMTPAPFSASRLRNGAFTWLMRMTTVRSSGVSMAATSLNTSKLTAPVAGSFTRSKEYLTSAEVIGEPSWNLTPGRRWNV